MMQEFAVLDAPASVVLSRNGGRCFARLDGMALYGSGETIEIALADLDRRYRDLVHFSTESGVPLTTLVLTGPHAGARDRWTGIKKVATIVVCFGLMMVPVSYALSTALERTVTNLDIKSGAKFWQGLQQGLIRAADPQSGPMPEEQEKTLTALRSLVQRAQPYADTIKPLFAAPARAEATVCPEATTR